MKRILFLISIIFILISSCEDKKRSFLIGKWEDIPRVAVQKERFIWNFQDDNNLIIEKYNIDTVTGEQTLDKTISGEYTFKREKFEDRLRVEITDGRVDLYPINGKYWVDEIDRSILKITRDGFISDTLEGNPFVRRELLKL